MDLNNLLFNLRKILQVGLELNEYLQTVTENND